VRDVLFGQGILQQVPGKNSKNQFCSKILSIILKLVSEIFGNLRIEGETNAQIIHRLGQIVGEIVCGDIVVDVVR
jgi:hypothetical protein